MNAVGGVIPADHPDQAILEASADLQRQLQHLRVDFYSEGIDSPADLENATDVPAQQLVALRATTLAGLATRGQWLTMNQSRKDAIEHYTQRAADMDVDFNDRISSAILRDILAGASA